jgi:serine/threonine protein kinase
MICGRPLFTGDSRKMILAKHVKTKPIEPVRVNRDIPKALSNLLMKMVAKKPTERFPSMDALIQRLNLVAEGRVAITTPTRMRHRA